MLDAIWRDVRYGLRGLIRSPGFTAAAVLTLALGIGLNATIFSVVNAVLLRPLPVTRPDRLVSLFTSSDTGAPYSSTSYPDYLDLAAQNDTLDGLATHTLMFAGVEHDDATRVMVGEIVSPNYFDVLGVAPLLGRGFRAGDDRPDAIPTTVISHRMWQRDFAGDPAILTRDLVIRGRHYAIVGVAPRDFNGLAAGVSAALWLPAGRIDDVEAVGINDDSPSASGTTKIERRGQRWLFPVGRLKPGVTVEQAQANLGAVMARFEHDYPVSNTHRRMTVVKSATVRIHPDVDTALAPSALILTIAVGIVLLVACSNIASLLLARATGREREMAVRLAIGASRGQLIRQLIVESLLLSLVGAGVGLLFTIYAAGALSSVQPPMQVSVAFDFAPDLRVFLYATAIACVAGLVFGLAPALRASRPTLVPALKGETRRLRSRGISLRSALTGAQIALSTVLLVVAALLLRSFLAATHADVRFDASKVVYAAINAGKQFPDAAHVQAFYDDAERRLREIPGVTAVARVDRLPFSLTNNTAILDVAGVPGTATGGGVAVDVTNVGVEYFTALGIPIQSGRAFTTGDTPGSAPVAIVNETAAAKFWPGRDPIGQHFKIRNGAEYVVVGVARNHPVRTIGESPRPFVHFAIAQARPTFSNFVVRTESRPADLVPQVRRALLAIEPRLAFMALEPMAGAIDATLFPARAGAVMVGLFGTLALMLAVIGLYGVVAFDVSRRTREIGIRMAIGASRATVASTILAGSLRIVAVGLGCGLLASGAAARALAGLLIGVSAFDPLSFMGAAFVLALAATAASLIPAIRAATIDPLVALRNG